MAEDDDLDLATDMNDDEGDEDAGMEGDTAQAGGSTGGARKSRGGSNRPLTLI